MQEVCTYVQKELLGGGGEDVEETGSVGHGESMVKCEAVGGQ